MSDYLVILLIFQTSLVAGSPIITPSLKSSFTQTPLINIFVTLRDSPLPIIQSVASQKIFDRSSRLNSLYTSLVNHASTTQAPILTFLSSLGNQIEFKSFWITNQIFVKNADLSLVEKLEINHENLISSIDEEWIGYIVPPVLINTNITTETNALQWGVQTVQGPEAWAELGGAENGGKGVLVATIDSGARGTHEILRDNFVGQYGWYDAVSGSAVPIDDSGHGTHVLGTMVGKNGYGVAPGAKWAACRACDENTACTGFALTACFQFILCPHLPDGSRPDCSNAPHIASNSWIMNRGGNTYYKSMVAAWRAAGIIPVWANGNVGPSCGTVLSPADYDDVIGVGSTAKGDIISDFSSLGPTTEGKMKPDISAPGSQVMSAYHTGDDHYVEYWGTSMATPHVTGAAALLLTRNKNLSNDQVRNLLIDNADQQLTFSGLVCSGIRDNQFPNHVFGHGRLNAYRSVHAQSSSSELAEVK